MTRRGFLRLLCLAPAGVAAAPGLVQKMAARPYWPWRAVAFWEKEFDFGTQLGVAVQAVNVATGETRRNALRGFVHRHLGYMEGVARMRAGAKERLLRWVGGLNEPWRRNALGAGVVGDDVLEGREQPL